MPKRRQNTGEQEESLMPEINKLDTRLLPTSSKTQAVKMSDKRNSHSFIQSNFNLQAKNKKKKKKNVEVRSSLKKLKADINAMEGKVEQLQLEKQDLKSKARLLEEENEMLHAAQILDQDRLSFLAAEVQQIKELSDELMKDNEAQAQSILALKGENEAQAKTILEQTNKNKTLEDNLDKAQAQLKNTERRFIFLGNYVSYDDNGDSHYVVRDMRIR